MYPLGHIGITLLLGRIVSEKLKIPLNVKLILIASILPDILDKPLGIVGMGGGRFIFHSLIFVVLMYFIRKELFFGCAVHLILDRMWEEPDVLLFPFLGLPTYEEVSCFDFILFFLQSRYAQAGELVGSISLIIYKTTTHQSTS